MRFSSVSLLAAVVVVPSLLTPQDQGLVLPKSVEAGSAFSIRSGGSGKGILYIAGPGQVLRREVQLGETIAIESGALYNAGRYVVVLSGSRTESGVFDVVPVRAPAQVSFLAKPSRLPVGLHAGITGTAYVFDNYRNLITFPTTVTFELSPANGVKQTRAVHSRLGGAWAEMDSTAQEGNDSFVARAGDATSSRVIAQVPGDPCALKISAKPLGENIELQTEPVRDCSGNAIPDGTVVTFTEVYGGAQATVDVPVKRGTAKVEMPAQRGATITVASGVVLGNQIRWE